MGTGRRIALSLLGVVALAGCGSVAANTSGPHPGASASSATGGSPSPANQPGVPTPAQSPSPVSQLEPWIYSGPITATLYPGSNFPQDVVCPVADGAPSMRQMTLRLTDYSTNLQYVFQVRLPVGHWTSASQPKPDYSQGFPLGASFGLDVQASTGTRTWVWVADRSTSSWSATMSLQGYSSVDATLQNPKGEPPERVQGRWHCI